MTNKNTSFSLSKFAAWYPAFFGCFTFIILGLTLFPADSLAPRQLLELDKVWHGLFLGIWTFLLGLIFTFNLKHYNPGIIMTGLIGFAFGVFIEILQHLLPVYRSADYFDVVANTIGIALALLILRHTIPFDNG